MKTNNITSDISFSAISAGFVAVVIGYASAVAIVFQAAISAGANHQMIESWIWALGLGMGLGCVGLSFYYKRPIIIAWSTPGAALLASSLNDISIEQATGIFIFVGLLTLITGLTGVFDKLTKRIPLPLASAMLAGILVQFGFDLFGSLGTEPLLVGLMIITYLVTKRFMPRYSIIAVLAVGFTFVYVLNLIDLQHINWRLAQPIWVTPEFDWSALVGIGLPLFIVTMTSQNMPGIAILRSSMKKPLPVSPLLSWTGTLNTMLAPFGAFTLCIAAITAAICASEEAHPDPNKRYIAGVSAGVFNVLAGVGGATVVGIFTAFPAALVAALAGLALLGIINTSLVQTIEDARYREAAVITFLVTASGISFFGIASAFWGIVIGSMALAIRHIRMRPLK